MVKREHLYEIAQYFIKNESTVRETAKNFGISKTNMHKLLTKDIPKKFPELCESVREILEKNRKEAVYRGGMATKIKYQSNEKKEE